jgi:hypothetical protein
VLSSSVIAPSPGASALCFLHCLLLRLLVFITIPLILAPSPLPHLCSLALLPVLLASSHCSMVAPSCYKF